MNEETPETSESLKAEEKVLNEIDQLSKGQISRLSSEDPFLKTRIEGQETNDLKESREYVPTEKTILRPQLSLEPVPQQVRYEIVKILGQGGMGIVYLVKDYFLGREVALKTAKIKEESEAPLSKNQKNLLWRLKKEAVITSILEHPNIIPIYEVHEQENGNPQVFMRRVEGENFRSVLKKMKTGETPYHEKKLLDIFIKICHAISYAHFKGIVHRDLKPDNIMLGKFGEVYVLDWGIAKRINQSEEEEEEIAHLLYEEEYGGQEDLFKTFKSLGTHGYMPPEQQENASKVTPRSDIFALGKILKECFTLISPREEFQELVKENERRLKEGIPSIKQTQTAKIPADIEAIIDKSTQENPEDRYAQVQDLINDIERYQQNLMISARRYSVLEMILKWIHRHKRWILFGELVSFICIGFLGYFYFERWSRFQEAYTKAITIHENASKYKVPNISKLLEGLRYLNEALSIAYSKEVEMYKLDIGNKLIELSCLNKNYKLAEYIGTEMCSLSILTTKQKDYIKEEIEKKKNETRDEHLQKLETWSSLLTQQYTTDTEKENIIFEISKMTEDDVWSKLIQNLQEGTHYHAQSPTENLLQEQYYEVMSKALGRLNRAESAPYLLESLKKLAEQISARPAPSTPQMNYMLVLSVALEQTNAENIASDFLKIRLQMGQNKLFWQRTGSLYKNLLLQESVPKKITKEEDLYSMAFLKLELEEFKEAVQLLDQLLKMNPNQSRYYYTRGNAWFYQKNYENALKDYTVALEKNPNEWDALLNRGVVKMALQENEEALADFTNIIQSAPTIVESYNNRGLLYLELEKQELAIYDFQQAILLSPQSSEAYYNLGLAYQQIGVLDQAIFYFEQAIFLNPEYTKAYFARAFVKQEQGNFYGALTDYQFILRIDPHFTEASVAKEKIFQKLNKTNEEKK